MIFNKISIVVPVYNVEAYIGCCLDSLINQDFEEYEIICINDGSIDNSQFIIDEYMSKYSFIKLIKQENQGLSVARNNGLKVAKGEYVLFVDSDDFLEPNILKSIYQIAKNNDLDILDYNINSYKNKEKKIWSGNHLRTEKPISGKDYFNKYIYQFKEQPSVSAWSHLFKNEFIKENRLEFIPGRYYEDLPFTAEAYFLAKKVMFNDVIVYNYRISGSSITRSILKKKHVEDIIFIASRIHDLSLKYNVRIPTDNFFSALIKQIIFFIRKDNLKECKAIIFPNIFKRHKFNLYKNKNRVINILLKRDFLFYLFLYFQRYSSLITSYNNDKA